jgi:hypothetical protein
MVVYILYHWRQAMKNLNGLGESGMRLMSLCPTRRWISPRSPTKPLLNWNRFSCRATDRLPFDCCHVSLRAHILATHGRRTTGQPRPAEFAAAGSGAVTIRRTSQFSVRCLWFTSSSRCRVTDSASSAPTRHGGASIESVEATSWTLTMFPCARSGCLAEQSTMPDAPPFHATLSNHALVKKKLCLIMRQPGTGEHLSKTVLFFCETIEHTILEARTRVSDLGSPYWFALVYHCIGPIR